MSKHEILELIGLFLKLGLLLFIALLLTVKAVKNADNGSIDDDDMQF